MHGGRSPSRWVLTLAIAFGVVVASATSSIAGTGRPAHPAAVRVAAHPALHPAGAITAVVVRSWGACSGASLAWDDLNANWALYGTIPISIDYSNQSLCGGTSITLAALEASGANVVILSDVAGGTQQLSQDEVDAIQAYAEEGHNLIGTYLTFVWGTIDNSALAPLFGLSAGGGYSDSNPIIPTYMVRYPPSQLFRDIAHPFRSNGYNFMQMPGDGRWSENELQGGGTIVAKKFGRKGAIVVNEAAAYDAVYISNMPEYNTAGSTPDEQFLYNAIIYPATG
jgi:hypothetical protein